MPKVDFITLANIIFKDKDKYKFVSDEEKEDSFFMLNRKFAYRYLRKAQFFNNKNINKSSSLDIWYQIFYNTTNGTPDWWWKTKQPAKNKIKPEFSSNDINLIKDYYDIKNNDIDFLIKYYSQDLKSDIKRLKKFKNE
jgi:hypothetical protein